MNTRDFDLQKSLEDGVLIDTSHIARKVGLPYPTFISSAFWNSIDIERMECRVLLALEIVGVIAGNRIKSGEFGEHSFYATPNLEKRGWPRAACPFEVPLKVTLIRSEQFVAIVFVTCMGETIDFRCPRTPAGGSFFTM